MNTIIISNQSIYTHFQVCQTTPDGQQFIVGDASSTDFSVDDLNNIVVTYSSIDVLGIQRYMQ